jgi:hypothetical protein
VSNTTIKPGKIHVPVMLSILLFHPFGPVVKRRGSPHSMKRHDYRTKYHFVLQVKVAEGLI